MRPWADLTHYEILDVPAGATPFEVRQAYKTALEVYREDSIVIYSLFSGEEREEMLVRIEEAYATLINEKARYAYDQKLIQQGSMKEEAQWWSTRKNSAAGKSRGFLDTPFPSKGEKLQAIENPAVKEILSRELLAGMDLKRLRTELGITLEQIAEWTKIRPVMLQYIEEDRFNELPSRLHLKSFLKSYLQFFHLNPESLVPRYLKRIRD